MTIRSILFSVFFIGSTALAQQLAPFGRLMEQYYPTMSDKEEAPVWVYFTDKGPDALTKLSMAPQTMISQRSLERRRKVLAPERVVDLQDVPLEPSYVRSVSAIATGLRHEVRWFNAVSVNATKQQIDALRHLPFVSQVELVARFRRSEDPKIDTPPAVVEPSDPNLIGYGNSLTQNQQINTVAVHNLGINGQGVLIGIFDAGFSYPNHPALVTRPVVARYDFIANRDSLTWYSHGQNTFSTIGGFVDGTLVGPAYGASFVLARTEDANTETPIEEDAWARAIIWADSIGIDVSSTSLGYDTFDSPWPSYTWQNMDGATTVITRAANRAVELGIVVVNSAGNSGEVALPANTLGAPCDGFDVIAAGAVGSTGTRVTFSSVGPSADGRIKPDIMAMGSGVYVANGATGYTTQSGTSFSCPLSAGVAALVLSGNLNFGLTPAQVKEAMLRTASRASTPDRYYGYGILDALKAVNYAWIEHTPLQNTESTNPRTVILRIKSRVSLVGDSTRIVYGVNGTFTGSSLLAPTGNPNEFSGTIPFLGDGVLVTYYVAAKNQYVSTRLPLGAPTQYYSYRAGTDTDAPTVTHRILGNQSIQAWPSTMMASVTDANGVDSVYVEYTYNGAAQPRLLLSPVGDNSYSGSFPSGQVVAGDSIAYRIVAVDASSGHNVTRMPSTGYYRFAVVNYANILENFRITNGGFTSTNDWQLGTPSGSSPLPHSPFRCWGTNISGNYTVGPRLSSLTTPTYTVFSNRASFSFWHWYEIQGRFDGANVKLSINGGPFQVIHPVGGYPTAAMYTGFGNPLAGQPGYSDVQGRSWAQVTFDLTGIAVEGNTVAIKFDFGADNSLQYRGWYIDDFETNGVGTPVTVGVAGNESLPKEYTLEQNYPNPFNPSTIIRYALPAAGHVVLKVYNVLGQEVATLVDGIRNAGQEEAVWNAASVPSGVYYYRLSVANFSSTKKLLLVR